MPLLSLLQETPNTVNYMIAGYLVLAGLPILYVLSWIVRRRNLERDVELIRSLEAEQPAAAPGQAQPQSDAAR